MKLRCSMISLAFLCFAAAPAAGAEVGVSNGETATLPPSSPEPANGDALATRGVPQEPLATLSLWSSTPGENWLLHVGVGVGTQYWPLANGGANVASTQYGERFTANAALWYRITDRLSWLVPFPAFAYRFGDPSGVEVMPTVGLLVDSWSTSGFQPGFLADAAVRIRTARSQHVTIGASAWLPAYEDPEAPLLLGRSIGNDVDPRVRAGYSWTVGRAVTLGAQLQFEQDYYRRALTSEWVQPRGNVDVRVGSQAAVGVSLLYAEDVRERLGSYENVTIGTTLAF
jgi:hypothetical protein